MRRIRNADPRRAPHCRRHRACRCGQARRGCTRRGCVSPDALPRTQPAASGRRCGWRGATVIRARLRHGSGRQVIAFRNSYWS